MTSEAQVSRHPMIRDHTTNPGTRAKPAVAVATAGDWVDRVRLWHVVLLFLVVVLPKLGSMPLFEPDEGRYAEVPRAMLATGDLVTPRLNGLIFFDKPPLHYWLSAAAIAVFGENEFAVRLVSASSATVAIVIVWFLGVSMRKRRAGTYAALTLALSPLWALMGRVNSIDVTLATLVLATLACFWFAVSERSGGRVAWHGLFAFSAFAVLTKGLIGIVIPGGAAFFYLVLSKRWGLLRSVPWLSGTVLFLVIATPWHLAAAMREPGFLWYYFVHEHFLRYTTSLHARSQPLWFFIPVVVVGLLPWSGLIPAACRLPLRSAVSRTRDASLFLISWAGFVLVFFSISNSKLIPYILPAVPPLALLICLAMVESETEEEKSGRHGSNALLAAAILLGGLLGLFVWFGSGRTARFLDGLDLRSHVVLAVASIGIVITLDAFRVIRTAALATVVSRLGFSVLAFIASCVLIGGVLANDSSGREVAEYLREHGSEAQLIAYRCYPRTVSFYLEREIDLVEFEGQELMFGKSQLSGTILIERFPEAKQLRDRWRTGGELFLITRAKELNNLEQLGVHGSVALKAGSWVLLTNAPS